MNSNPNIENLQNLCRMCLKSGDINILNSEVSLEPDPEIYGNSFSTDYFIKKPFEELIHIFCNSQDLLNYTDEFPMLCQQCLEDLKFCYIVYEKIKLSNIQLINLYQESTNQCFGEEHLIEPIEENELIYNQDINLVETPEKEIVNVPNQEIKKSTQSKCITFDRNDSFIVTQFIPETLEVPETQINLTKSNDEEFRSQPHLLTVNLKAVEVQNLENIDRIDLPQYSTADEKKPAIYMCQYCPQAFAKSEYLRTHIQKSHVCKFCTQPFIVTEDLFRHIREVHTEYKCAICLKLLSSGTNLRHHIKRVHRLNLPAKVTLIDFIKSSSSEEKRLVNQTEISNEIETTDLDLNVQYVWNNDECIEMLSESNISEFQI